MSTETCGAVSEVSGAVCDDADGPDHWGPHGGGGRIWPNSNPNRADEPTWAGGQRIEQMAEAIAHALAAPSPRSGQEPPKP